MCDDYLLVKEDKISCYQPVCDERNKLNPDGTCTPCGEFEVTSENKKECQ